MRGYGGRGITIPDYKDQTMPKALPGVRLSTAADPDDFGAGVARAQGAFGAQLQQTGNILTDNAIKLQEETNARKVLDASNTYQAKVNDYLHNPEKGIMFRRGKDADGLYEQSQKEMAKIEKEVLESLENDRQRETFLKFVAGRASAVGEAVSKHQVKEMDRWGNETREGAKYQAIDSVGKNPYDPNHFAAQAESGLKAIESTMVGKHAPEAILAEKKDFISSLHESTIRAMLGKYDSRSARVWYDEHKDEISSQRREAINADIMKQERIDKSQMLNKELWAKYGFDTEAARKDLEARNLAAPELEYYIGQYRHEVAFRKNNQDRLHEKAYDDSIDQLVKLKAAGQLTPKNVQQILGGSGLTGKQFLSLQSHALSMMGLDETGRPKHTTREVWEQVNLAVQTGKINITQLRMNYGHLLSDSDYEHFFNAILKGTNGDEGFGWAADVTRIAKKAGVKEEDYGKLWAGISQRIDAFKGEKGRAPTVDEREQIVQDLVGKVTVEQRKFWFNKDEFNFKISPPVGAPAGTMWNTKINNGKGGWVFQDPKTGRWNEWIP